MTTFGYPRPAGALDNGARQLLVTSPRQTALEARLQTSPVTSRYAYRDNWGTRVVAFGVDHPHDGLLVPSRYMAPVRRIYAGAGEHETAVSGRITRPA